MAHKKKKTSIETPANDKMDQLLNIVSGLASEIKNMKSEIAEVKSGAIVPQKPEIIEPLDSVVTVQRETPYKVIPIESIIADEGYINKDQIATGRVKKIYRGMGRTFRNKAEALQYLEAARKRNPGQQYDIFPV